MSPPAGRGHRGAPLAGWHRSAAHRASHRGGRAARCSPGEPLGGSRVGLARWASTAAVRIVGCSLGEHCGGSHRRLLSGRAIGRMRWPWSGGSLRTRAAQRFRRQPTCINRWIARPPIHGRDRAHVRSGRTRYAPRAETPQVATPQVGSGARYPWGAAPGTRLSRCRGAPRSASPAPSDRWGRSRRTRSASRTRGRRHPGPHGSSRPTR